MFSLDRQKPQTQPQCAIYSLHRLGSERSQAFHESLPIDGADLVREHDGLQLHTTLRRRKERFGRIERCFVLGRNGAHDRNRAVAIRDIILDD